MKKFICLIISTLLCMFFYAGASAQSRWEVASEEYKEAAEALFVDFVPDNAETNNIYSLYVSGEYEQAIDAYRNFMMDKLKSTYWLFQDNYASKYIYDGKFTEPAKYIVGDWDAKTLMTTFSSDYGDMRYWPDDELLGDPYRKIEYNWPQGWADSYSDNLGDNVYNAPMNTFYHNILTGYYFITGDQRYADKMMQIGAHFAVNGKKQADEYNEKYDVVGKDYGIFFSRNDTVPVLQLQGLVTMYIQDFLLLSKYAALDREQVYTEFAANKRSGVEIKNLFELPVNAEIPDENYEIIDSLKFAQIMNNIIHTIMPYIDENITLSNFTVSNVKLSAIQTMLKASLICNNFSSITPMFENALELSIQNISEMAYPDGGFLEEHMNYSQSNYTTYMVQYMTLAGLGMSTESALLKRIRDFLDNYEKFYISICSPVGLAMPYGNSPLRGYPAIWKDKAAYDTLKNSNGIHEVTGYSIPINEEDRGYTSIYFPMTGALVMRRDWTILSPMHFSMFTSNMRGAGHKSANTNAVWLSAYGRTLLCSGNVHWYATNFAPANQVDEFKEYNEYFLETDTFKNSTVAVNGLSQNAVNIKGIQADKAKQIPIENMKWSSSNRFDFGEGYWDAGYGEAISYADTTHLRQAIYSKDANMIVLTDTMTSNNSKENEFRQIWNFPEFLEGTDNTGFTDEQVVVDNVEKRIYTSDKEGPNVFLMQFSNESISYRKYYGSKDNELGMYLGWGGNTYNITTGRIPKADVHVIWHNSDNLRGNKSQMISVLMPSENTECPYEYKKDLSDKKNKVSGFEIKSKTGIITKYLSSPKAVTLDLGDVSANAKNLLLEYSGNKIGGIVLDCAGIRCNGKEISVNGSFEFEIIDNELKIKSYITAPTTFEWHEGFDGEYPVYSNSMPGETVTVISEIQSYEGQIVSLTRAGSSDAEIIIAKGIDYIIKNIDAVSENTDNDTKQLVLEYINNIADCAVENGMEESARLLTDRTEGIFGR